MQWLRLRAANAGGTGLIPGRETKILHPSGMVKKKKRKRKSPDSSQDNMRVFWDQCIITDLFLHNKSYDQLDSILKSRDITLPTKVHLVKAMVFPVVMYGCESWTVKKAERWRTDAFELWCWRRLLRVPWTARRSNQSILKRSVLGVHWKDWCWSWNSSTLATSCEELTHWKRPWCWEGLGTGG